MRACAAQDRTTPAWLSEAAVPASDAPMVGGAYGSVDDRDRIERAFRRLSVEHRAVLVLRYLLDLSWEQTAEALDISMGTVGSRLDRAREALRAALDADDRPPPRLTEARASER